MKQVLIFYFGLFLGALVMSELVLFKMPCVLTRLVESKLPHSSHLKSGPDGWSWK